MSVVPMTTPRSRTGGSDGCPDDAPPPGSARRFLWQRPGPARGCGLAELLGPAALAPHLEPSLFLPPAAELGLCPFAGLEVASNPP